MKTEKEINKERHFKSAVGIEIGMTRENRNVNLWFSSAVKLVALRKSEVKKLIENLRWVLNDE